ncbi:MAG: amino acid adenylation domain-containing protein [Bacteroidales bacterium]|nr:amino acid adenylation domain-containing protein [Bacteroidales bacterium]
MMTTIYDAFKTQVEARPEALAVMDERETLTYAQLDALATMIADGFPVEAPSKVGIVMSHSVKMIATILAALKTGAAYVPAEPTFPKERIKYMMQDCDFVVTDEGIRKGTATSARVSDLAYILYTSGTTGRPKGVMVTNKNVLHYVRAFRHEFNTQPGDRMLQHSVCSFDIFVEEVFTTLLSGATLCIPSDETKADIHRLMVYIERNQVTMLSGFPYLLLEMNRLERIPSCLRLLISGGDVIRGKYIDHLRTQNVMIYNTYGPSETTVCASYFRVDNAEPLADGTFSIGKAVLGTNIEILDEDLKPVKDGEAGEICIFGDGISLGYSGDVPENANFTTMPDSRRVYRSGDLGYVMPDGNLAFLHRKDKQVMIMGKRVESDEVENVLCEEREVETAVVCPQTDTDGLSYLVAYVVPRTKGFSLSSLKRSLADRLTSFMIPELFVMMPSLPMTPNGKVDRKALPQVRKEGRLYAA